MSETDEDARLKIDPKALNLPACATVSDLIKTLSKLPADLRVLFSEGDYSEGLGELSLEMTRVVLKETMLVDKIDADHHIHVMDFPYEINSEKVSDVLRLTTKY